jgi:FtsP/CotA-like multicopper oxidase with cupredoxin domain
MGVRAAAVLVAARRAIAFAPLAVALGCSIKAPRASAAPPEVVANDNRTSAGTLRDGVLTLELDVVMARWHPEAADGPFVDVPTFAEHGKAPMIPAPMVRVPVGTRVRLVVRNTLADSAVGLWGMGVATNAANLSTDTTTLTLAAGASRTLEFTASTAGTYMYGARSANWATPLRETEQLAGAIIVDEPGARTDDRIFVVNIWYDGSNRNVYALNGRSWPHTERFDVTEGDTLHWRVVNPTTEEHPMHLHGAYYRVDARGDARADTAYAADAQRMVVTELMVPRSTMRMTWSPATPGNWLFHCHNSFHVGPGARLDAPVGGGHDAHSTDPQVHMSGLVIGVAVRARGADMATRSNARRLAAVIAHGTATDTAHAAPIVLQLVPGDGSTRAAPLAPRGDLLLLTRGEPTDITVRNTLGEPSAIHWHGLELESWSDGVAGLSGIGTKVAPAIAPGDSFVARLTLKRAGTFIYHTHLNDHAQLSAGLFGPIVVLEPGQRWDPAHDLVFTAGLDRTALDAPAVNGGNTEPEFTMRAGDRVRMRFINIQPEEPATYVLVRDARPADWRAMAKDGFELHGAQAAIGAARRTLWPGETFDAEFAPTAPGLYQLRMIASTGKVAYERMVRVRP